MKTYAQRMKKPLFANPQQNLPATAQISNQAMLGMLNEPEGDTRFSEALRARFETKNEPHAKNGTPLSSVEQTNYENRFALPMDDVRVYHNSDVPSKFDAGAITYGTDIYIAPGQDELLSHEMTHVAQQKLGQAKPTDIENQLPISRESSLENNADEGLLSNVKENGTYPVVQCCKEIDDSNSFSPNEEDEKKYINELTPPAPLMCHHFTSCFINKAMKDTVIDQYSAHEFYQSLIDDYRSSSDGNPFLSKVTSENVNSLTPWTILLFANPKEKDYCQGRIAHSMIVSADKDKSWMGTNNTCVFGGYDISFMKFIPENKWRNLSTNQQNIVYCAQMDENNQNVGEGSKILDNLSHEVYALDPRKTGFKETIDAHQKKIAKAYAKDAPSKDSCCVIV